MLKTLNGKLFVDPNDQAGHFFYKEFGIAPLPPATPWIANYHDIDYDAYCQKTAPTKPEGFSAACLLPDPAGFLSHEAKATLKPHRAPDSPILAAADFKTKLLETENTATTVTTIPSSASCCCIQ